MKAWTLGASALLHAAVFAVGSLVMVEPARYGIQAGQSSIEVELVAAPAAAEPAANSELDLPEPEMALPGEMEMPAPVTPLPVPRPALPPPPRPAQHLPRAAQAGDGSSQVPGRDAVTRRSEGGAQEGLARPNYLRNPPPPYPEAARRQKQEGLVRLRVRVNALGAAVQVDLEQSSGWPLLDQAALRAVKSWRFHPARVGGVPMESTVTVPVRFELSAARE